MGVCQSTFCRTFIITHIPILPKATRSSYKDDADSTIWTACIGFWKGFEKGRSWPTTLPLSNYMQGHSYLYTIRANRCLSKKDSSCFYISILICIYERSDGNVNIKAPETHSFFDSSESVMFCWSVYLMFLVQPWSQQHPVTVTLPMFPCVQCTPLMERWITSITEFHLFATNQNTFSMDLDMNQSTELYLLKRRTWTQYNFEMRTSSTEGKIMLIINFFGG